MKIIEHRSYLVLAALVCAAGAQDATAASAPYDPASVTISYSELDISKPKGAAALYRRVERAARTVCDVGTSKELARIRLSNECYRTAVANAVATLNRPLVTAVHRSKVMLTGTG
jgi:UrcA family protein